MPINHLQEEILPVFAWKPPSTLGEDSYIYYARNASLIYSNSPLKLNESHGNKTTIDGRAVLLECSSQLTLFNYNIRDKRLQKLLHHNLSKTIHSLDEDFLAGNSFFCGDRFSDGNMCHTAFDHLARAWLANKSPLHID